MAASYPTTPVVFPARSDGQTIFAAHVNALQDEVAAIEASLFGQSQIPTVNTGLVKVTNPNPQVIFYDSDQPVDQRIIQITAAQNLFRLDATNDAQSVWTPMLLVSRSGAITERARAVPMGEWTDVPFNVANFWAGVAAGNVAVNRYALVGKTMFWMLQIANCPAPSPASSNLPVTLPGGYSATGSMTAAGYVNGNPGAFAQPAGGGGTVMNICTLTGATWPAGFYVYINMTISLL